MIEKKRRINNPISLISIFAGIPMIAIYEVKSISPEYQNMYLLFVGGFIVLLIIFTFIILIFKPSNLYSPRDFRDEQNFLIMWEISNRKTKKKKITENKVKDSRKVAEKISTN